MDIREAAERVLKEARKPLHVREIARIALEKGLWQTRGKTPHASWGPHHRKEESPFILVAPQTFGLRDHSEEPPPRSASS